MKSVGIIAEYNPFHIGHKYQLEQAKKASGADVAVVVMSQCFTQRGELAIFSPYARAKMALLNGADAVFALPTMVSCRDGGNFALGGVRLLDSLGVDGISFGVETDDTDLLFECSDILYDEQEEFHDAFRKNMDGGKPYPEAVSMALRQKNRNAAQLLESPNNLLATEYIRAVRQIGSKMQIYPVHRQGNYNSTSLGEAMPSAAAVRNAIYSGNYAALEEAIPESCMPIFLEEIENGRIARPCVLDSILTYRLRSMSDDEFAALPDVSEGIERRLQNAARENNGRERIIQSAKTKRYTYARLSRMCAHALLHLTAKDFDDEKHPVRLLGFRDSALPFLNQLKKKGIVPSKPSREYSISNSTKCDMLAYDIWACACNLPAGIGFTGKVIRV